MILALPTWPGHAHVYLIQLTKMGGHDQLQRGYIDVGVVISGMLDRSESEHSTPPPKNVDEPHSPKVERKKPDVKECTLHDSITRSSKAGTVELGS